MGKLKRDYLNDNEENFYMLIKSLMQVVDGSRNDTGSRYDEMLWDRWMKSGMMTPEMKKNLKCAYTYLGKFTDELYENLDDRQQNKLDKRLSKYEIKLVDDFKVQKLLRDISDRYKYAVIERDNFNDIMVDIAQVRCVGCEDDYRNCEICRVFDDMCIPYSGEKKNCPFASDLSEFTDDEKE